MKHKSLTALCFLLLLSGIVAASAEPSLTLDWYKQSGFSVGNGINGAWTITPLFSDNASYVEFYLDGQLQQNATSAPFSWSFDTANYAEGYHTIKAVAFNPQGESATASEERDFTGFPVIYIVGVAVFGVFAFAVLLVLSWFWIKDKARARRANSAVISGH